MFFVVHSQFATKYPIKHFSFPELWPHTTSSFFCWWTPQSQPSPQAYYWCDKRKLCSHPWNFEVSACRTLDFVAIHILHNTLVMSVWSGEKHIQSIYLTIQKKNSLLFSIYYIRTLKVLFCMQLAAHPVLR